MTHRPAATGKPVAEVLARAGTAKARVMPTRAGKPLAAVVPDGTTPNPGEPE